MGAGTGSTATTAAQRAAAAQLKDECWKLEVREVQLLHDETTMYSPQRALFHPCLIAFSREKIPNTSNFRNKFTQSQLYIRRALVQVPVTQRCQFRNPTRKIDTVNAGIETTLSAPAELKQHVSGAALYSAVPRLVEHASYESPKPKPPSVAEHAPWAATCAPHIGRC